MRKNSYSLFIACILILVASATVYAGRLTYVEVHKDELYNVDGLNGAVDVAVSPDGKHVYAAGSIDNAVAVFSRDATLGQLTFVESHVDGASGVDGLGGASAIAISADGNHVYVTGNSDNAVAVFSRDATSGHLTFVESHVDDASGVDGLGGASAVAISADGKHVYVTGNSDHAVAVFSRNTTSGQLTFVEFHKDEVDGADGLNQASAVEVSPDGNHLYVGTSAFDYTVALFGRNATTGELSFLGDSYNVSGLSSTDAISISSDGKHLYAASDAEHGVETFSRNAAGGQVTLVEVHRDGVGGVDGLLQSRDIIIEPDGKYAYAAGFGENAVAVFSRNATSGQLTFVEAQKNGVNGVDGLYGASAIAVSPDEKNLYVAGYDDDAVAVFQINPLDTDLDGLYDSVETNTGTYVDADDTGSNPNVADTDGDGLNDGDEVNTHNTNPVSEDTDSDSMPDGWEVNNGLDPTVNDARSDLDGDGANNLLEYNRGTDPNDADSRPNTSMPWLPLLLD
ncbi:beta-propeller fold lactonase family protein [Thermodesulfobacteriota bacterium]